MFSEQVRSGLIQGLKIESRPDPPGKPLQERVPDRFKKKMVAVRPRMGGKARVKFFANGFHIADNHIGGQQGVGRPFEGIRAVAPIHIEGDHLPGCVDSGIRPPGRKNGFACPADSPESILQDKLDCAHRFLPLKSMEISAVVSKD